MSRLIDADALKEAFREDGHLSGYIEDFIDDCPTVESKRNIPQPVAKKGSPHSYVGYRYYCPECGKQQKMSKWGLWYCERCGQALIKEEA